MQHYERYREKRKISLKKAHPNPLVDSNTNDVASMLLKSAKQFEDSVEKNSYVNPGTVDPFNDDSIDNEIMKYLLSPADDTNNGSSNSQVPKTLFNSQHYDDNLGQTTNDLMAFSLASPRILPAGTASEHLPVPPTSMDGFSKTSDVELAERKMIEENIAFQEATSKMELYEQRACVNPQLITSPTSGAYSQRDVMKSSERNRQKLTLSLSPSSPSQDNTEKIGPLSANDASIPTPPWYNTAKTMQRRKSAPTESLLSADRIDDFLHDSHSSAVDSENESNSSDEPFSNSTLKNSQIKQSRAAKRARNRASAYRSRLRKKIELENIKNEIEKFTKENAKLEEKIRELQSAIQRHFNSKSAFTKGNMKM